MLNLIMRLILISVVRVWVIAVVSWIIIQLAPWGYVSDAQPQYMQFLKWVARMFKCDFGYVLGNQGGAGSSPRTWGVNLW